MTSLPSQKIRPVFVSISFKTLVRSNPDEEIGFLEDLRRLNVALTRAKRKLILVGDAKTLGTHPVYRKLVDFVKRKGRYLTIENLEFSKEKG